MPITTSCCPTVTGSLRDPGVGIRHDGLDGCSFQPGQVKDDTSGDEPVVWSPGNILSTSPDAGPCSHWDNPFGTELTWTLMLSLSRHLKNCQATCNLPPLGQTHAFYKAGTTRDNLQQTDHYAYRGWLCLLSAKVLMRIDDFCLMMPMKCR